MRLSRKIIATSLLGIIVSSNISTKGIDIFADTKKVNNNLIVEESNTKKVEDVLQEEKLLDIKKINLDDSGKPISAEDLDFNKRNLDLHDGYYTLNYGDGWIKGKDSGLVGSIVVPAGASGVFQKTTVNKFTHKITVQASLSFKKDIIEATVKAGYGHAWTNGSTEEVYKTISATDKNLFAKVHTTYNRIDVINVKNGNIIDSATTYKPTSYSIQSIEYNVGDKGVDSKLYLSEDTCIMGNSGYDTHGSIDVSGKYEGYANFKNQSEDYWSTKTYKESDVVGLYFTVPQDATYEIKETVFLKHPIYTNRGVGAQMKLYKVDNRNDSRISYISSRPYSFREIGGTASFLGEPIVANLKSNEKYLLVFNSDGQDRYWSGSNNVSYRVRLKRL